MSVIKLICSYDGTSYLGWQKTKMGPSIEEELEKVLHQILGEPCNLQAASRTDRGVHAKGQVVAFATSKTLSMDKLKKGLNSLLPSDIRILEAGQEHCNFHPTIDCKAKEYHYEVCLDKAQLPFHRQFSWHFPYAIDLQKVAKGASFLIGTHDFSAFCNMRLFLQEDKVRTIYTLEAIPLPGNRLCIRVVGNRFLYKMVRNIVGTLLYIGCGKLTVDELPLILKNKDRKASGVTAPAHGLFLQQVLYNLP